MYTPTTCEDSRRFTSSPESASGLTPFARLVGKMTVLYGQAPALASRSQLPATEQAWMTSAISGRTCSDSSKHIDLPSLWESRLRARMGSPGSTLYKRDRLQGRLSGWPNPARGLVYGSTRRDGTVDGVGHPYGDGFEPRGEASATNGYWSATDTDGRAVWVADTGGERRQQDAGGAPGHEEAHGREPHLYHIFAGDVQVHRSHPTYGFWGNPDWLLCKDGRWRPIEPGVTALVDEPASRVVSSSTSWRTPAGPKGFGHIPSQVKGYGNAICSVQAQAFIEAVMEHRP